MKDTPEDSQTQVQLTKASISIEPGSAPASMSLPNRWAVRLFPNLRRSGDVCYWHRHQTWPYPQMER
jgi:hypothetical protein